MRNDGVSIICESAAAHQSPKSKLNAAQTEREIRILNLWVIGPMHSVCTAEYKATASAHHWGKNPTPTPGNAPCAVRVIRANCPNRTRLSSTAGVRFLRVFYLNSR